MEANSEKTTVLIVGAGIGGIATAARLRRNGYRVTVVEKCKKSGGRCGQMIVQGHGWRWVREEISPPIESSKTGPHAGCF